MSHVSDVKLSVKDEYLDEFEAVVNANPLLEFRRGQKTHAYWGSYAGDSRPPEGIDPKDFGKCEHAIGFRGVVPQNGMDGRRWEIGLVRAADGGYRLLTDTWGSGQSLANHVPELRREYAAKVSTKRGLETLSRHGWRAEREEMPGNRIRVKLRKR